MKVFISWAGNRSQAVAALLHGWIKCVLQATQPWISSRNIARGSVWLPAINEQLQDASVGIICLTKENLNKPWILFEAGALAKGLPSSRVCTFLVDLKPSDISDPLAQFNHTFPDRSSVRSLLDALNEALELHSPKSALPGPVLDAVFETYWPKFETTFSEALKVPVNEQAPGRTDHEILAEILSAVRSTDRRVATLEAQARFPIYPETNAQPPTKPSLFAKVAQEGPTGPSMRLNPDIVEKLSDMLGKPGPLGQQFGDHSIGRPGT